MVFQVILWAPAWVEIVVPYEMRMVEIAAVGEVAAFQHAEMVLQLCSYNPCLAEAVPASFYHSQANPNNVEDM